MVLQGKCAEKTVAFDEEVWDKMESEDEMQFRPRRLRASIPLLLGSIVQWPAPHIRTNGQKCSSLAARILLLAMTVPRVYAQLTLQAWHQETQRKQRVQLENTVELLQAEL